MSSKTCTDMRWHKEKRVDDGVLRHPADGMVRHASTLIDKAVNIAAVFLEKMKMNQWESLVIIRKMSLLVYLIRI